MKFQPRQTEPELMDLREEAVAYAAADFSEVNQKFVDRLLEHVGRGNGADRRLLDLGTGPADIPIRIAKALSACHIVAVDGSDAMLDLARAAVKSAGVADNIRFILADVKATGLADHGFDVIFSNSLLHHMHDPDPLWSEIKRLAKPGALLFLRDLARPASAQDALDLVERHAGAESRLLQEEFHRSLLAAFTVDEVRSQLTRAGLGHLTVLMASDRHLDISGRVE